MASDPQVVALRAAGRASPAGTTRPTSTRTRRSSRTPRSTPVPADLRARDRGAMAKYPDRRSAAIPALYAVQQRYGWCTPEGDRAGGMRDAPHAGLPDRRRARSTTCSRRSRSVATTVYVCTNISCSLCGADELLAALREEAGDDPDFNVRGFECLGACDIAPMASVNGEYVGPLELDEVPELVRQIRAGRRAAARQAARSAARASTRRPGGAHDRHPPLQGHRRARSRDTSTSTSAAAATQALRKALQTSRARR